MGGPDHWTIAGLEYTTVLILVREMQLAYAGRFPCVILLSCLCINPSGDIEFVPFQNDLRTCMRISLACCAMSYLGLHVLRHGTPEYFQQFMIPGIWAYFLYVLITNKATRLGDTERRVYKELGSVNAFQLLRIRPSAQLDNPISCELIEVLPRNEAPNTYLVVSY